MSISSPSLGYFFAAPGKTDASSDSHDEEALKTLFLSGIIVDHPAVVSFFQGLGADPSSSVSAAAAFAFNHTTLWGTCQLGLYAMNAPLENVSSYGFMAALHMLLPDKADPEGKPIRTWGYTHTHTHTHSREARALFYISCLRNLSLHLSNI